MKCLRSPLLPKSPSSGRNGATTTEKAPALETLIAYVFERVPGIAITRRDQVNVFNSEEVDVAFFKDGAPGSFPSLPNVILVESKNWSNRVGSHEIARFDTKVRDRGLPLGILAASPAMPATPQLRITGCNGAARAPEVNRYHDG